MKSLTELTLLDRFLFDQATQNPDVCKAMIELANKKSQNTDH